MVVASARTNAALAGFSRELTALNDPAALARAICDEIGRLFGVRTVMLTFDGQGLAVQAAMLAMTGGRGAGAATS